MDTYQVNAEIKKALQVNLFTTPEETDKIINRGCQAIVAHNFLQDVTLATSGRATGITLHFIREFIGQYEYVGTETEKDKVCIRFFHLTSDGSVNGVELLIEYKLGSATLNRLSGLYGFTTKDKLKKFIY